MNEIKSDELSEFVSSVLDGLEKATEKTKTERGIKRFVLWDKIDFELSVVTEKDTGGGLRIHVVDVGAKHTDTNISKIKFSIKRTVQEGVVKAGVGF